MGQNWPHRDRRRKVLSLAFSLTIHSARTGQGDSDQDIGHRSCENCSGFQDNSLHDSGIPLAPDPTPARTFFLYEALPFRRALISKRPIRSTAADPAALAP